MATDREYLKTIKLQVEADTSSAQRELNKFKSTTLAALLENTKDYDQVTEKIKEEAKHLEEIRRLKEAITQIDRYGTEEMKQQLPLLQEKLNFYTQPKAGRINRLISGGKLDIGGQISDFLGDKGILGNLALSITNKIVNVVKDGFRKLVDIAKDAWTEIGNMAAYSLGTSIYQNASTREQALKYGLSDAENYAFSRTKSDLGLSDEDLFWMNETQQERFSERIGYYTNKYNEFKKSGFFEKYEEFTLEYKEFKTELQMTFIKWIVDNKDIITSFFKVAQSFMSVVASTLTSILSIMKPSSSSDMSAYSDLANNYSRANSVNAKISVVNNGIDYTNQQQVYNTSEFAMKSLIKQLDGGE